MKLNPQKNPLSGSPDLQPEWVPAKSLSDEEREELLRELTEESEFYLEDIPSQLREVLLDDEREGSLNEEVGQSQLIQ